MIATIATRMMPSLAPLRRDRGLSMAGCFEGPMKGHAHPCGGLAWRLRGEAAISAVSEPERRVLSSCRFRFNREFTERHD